ncbi:MAG TPA: hypothetical protein VKJ07_22060, partial [Mycobacteriales bacterium]|nr:hypothetical protein [Mycobacteriales bacterium]
MTDDFDPEPLLSNDAPAVFPGGTTTVHWTAIDTAGNASTAFSTVTVNGAQTTITITAPADITIEATQPSGSPRTNSDVAAWLARARVTDSAAVAVLTNDTPAVLPLNVTTVVTFAATDRFGNYATAGGRITVRDTTAPRLDPPSAIGVAADGAGGNPATDAPIAGFLAAFAVSDAVDPNPVVSSDAPAVFPLGTTTVTFTATDASGNSRSAVSYVTVQDQTAPTVNAPAPITVEATVTGGAPASLPAVQAFLNSAAVSDDVDSAPTLVNDAPGFFPLGTTIIHFTARDASANVAVRSTSVTVADTTAPVAAITSPAAYDVVTGALHISGSATDLDFGRWALSLDGVANPFAGSTVSGAIAADLNTNALPDG